MKPIRFSRHAEKQIIRREVDKAEIERALAKPDRVAPGEPPRRIYMRRYFDDGLQTEMLLRVVAEKTANETVVVTLYKTSKFKKYMGEENG